MSEPATGISYEVIYEGFSVTYAVYQNEGPAGADGLGVPAGGTTGQVLAKVSNADNDTTWINDAGGISDAPSDGTAYRRKDAAWEADPNQIDLGPAIGSITSDLDTHVNDTSNPHNVTAAQAQADPVGSADAVQTNLDTHTGTVTGNPHQVTLADTGGAPAAVIPDYLVPQDLAIVGGEVEQDAALGTQARLEVLDAPITIRPPTNAPAGTSGTIAIVNDEASTVLLDTSFRGQGGLESDLTDNNETVLTWLVEGAGVKCWISKTEWTGTGV